MIKSRFKKYFKLYLISFILLNCITLSSIGLKEIKINEKFLPPPIDVDMILEESIFRRMSVREFKDEPVNDEDLSTILWAAFGLRDDGKHTISKINNTYSAIIYVLNEEAAYKYNPINHSLVVYKEGDFRGNGVRIQYERAHARRIPDAVYQRDPGYQAERRHSGRARDHRRQAAERDVQGIPAGNGPVQ